MGIDTTVPGSDGWWLQRLYNQLRPQIRKCEALRLRFEGNAPMPYVSNIQADAVKWFVAKSRTNVERVIVNAKLSRLQIRGIRTAVAADEGGDAEAFQTWERARGRLFSLDAHEMALSMSLSYVIVGKKPDGSLLVTAEDPRLVTAITDPADPYDVKAALKLFHDDTADEDVAYLYLPGRLMVAKSPRRRRMGSADVRFNPAAFNWDLDVVNAAGELVEGASGAVDWLAEYDEDGNFVGGDIPVVPFFNGKDSASAVAEFEPFTDQIDRINQQMLQRMTIATVQAFKQRAFFGLPKTDPDTGELIDYNAILTADPGAVWNLPALGTDGKELKIWESGEVDLGPLVEAHREDIKDLYSTSGTPAYLASPDAANSSAEAASLQREMTTFGVETLHVRLEQSHCRVDELIFKTLGDEARSVPGTVRLIWGPAERASMSERANAIAQTNGTMPKYQQLTEIWGMDPAQADRAMKDLEEDVKRGLTKPHGAAAAPGAPSATEPPAASPAAG